MAYFYVSNQIPGTKTVDGGDGTARTGAFSSMTNTDVYATVTLALADSTLTHGDVICVASDHAYDAATVPLTWTLPETEGSGVIIMSVDTANCDSYLAGAEEKAGASNDSFSFAGLGAIYGMSLYQSQQGFAGAKDITFFDCTISDGSTNDNIYLTTDGNNTRFENCTLSPAAGSGTFVAVGSGAVSEFVNCTLTTARTGIVEGIANSGGGKIDFVGCDFSLASGNLLVDSSTDIATQDGVIASFRDCKLHASVTYTPDTWTHDRYQLTVLNSAATSAAREYQFYKNIGGRTAQNNSTIYRTATYSFSDATKVCYEVNTTASTSRHRPFILTLRPRYTDLTNAASDTLTVELQSNDTLTNADVYVVVRYPDSTNKHVQDNTTTRPADPVFTAGTTLTTSAEAWSVTRTNQYKISVTVSGGAACVPYVDIYVCKNTGANALYICPKIDVS